MSGLYSICWIGTRRPNPTPPIDLIDFSVAAAAGWTAPPGAAGASKELGLIVVEQLLAGAAGALTGGSAAGAAGGVGSAAAYGECGI